MQQIRLQAWDVDNSKWVNVACDANGRMLTTFPKGRKPTDVLDGWDVSQDEIFDWLSPYIPNNDDRVIVSGGIADGNKIYIISYARRIDSITIRLYKIHINTLDQSAGNASMTMIDGNVTKFDYVSLAV